MITIVVIIVLAAWCVFQAVMIKFLRSEVSWLSQDKEIILIAAGKGKGNYAKVVSMAGDYWVSGTSIPEAIGNAIRVYGHRIGVRVIYPDPSHLIYEAMKRPVTAPIVPLRGSEIIH